MVRIGAHVSASKSLDLVFDRGLEIGAQTIQFFVNSPRSWKTRVRTDREIALFQKKRNKQDIYPIVVHASYLYNLASDDEQLRKRSITGVINDLYLCDELGIDFYVIHPGKAKDQSEKKALENIKRSLEIIFSKISPDTVFLLETLAGQKGEIGKTTQELKELLSVIPEDKTGICVDTCHIFSAGYKINEEEGFKSYKEEVANLVGLEKVKIIHCNDSKTPFNSRKDRHQHIGEGYIGMKGFELFLNDSYFGTLPYIIETPKTGNYDQINMERLRRAIKYSKCVRSSAG